MNHRLRKQIFMFFLMFFALAQTACKTGPAKPGKIELMAVLAEGGEPISSGLWWEVLKTEVEPGQKSKVVDKAGGGVSFELPAGNYLVTVTLGQARAEKLVTVKAESSAKDTLILNAGRKLLSATMVEGGEPIASGLWWEIFATKEGATNERTKITDRSSGTAEFIVPAGRYLATVTLGKARAQKEFEVKAGELGKEQLVLEAGLIRLSATAASGSAVSGGLWWEVFEAAPNSAGEQKKIADKGGGTVEFILPAGNYLVKVKMEGQKAEQTIDLTPGEKKEVNLILEQQKKINIA